MPYRWRPGRRGLPPLVFLPGEDLVGVGGDLSVETLLTAYSLGVFPMGLGGEGRPPIGWWSPAVRGVLRPAAMRITRSLRKSAAQFTATVDTDFEQVISACADEHRPGRWITPQIIDAYTALHERGHVHSIEIWRGTRLVGGLYGVSVGGLFAGESMFHRERDASKVALMELCSVVKDDGAQARLIDVQWPTPHLASLGVEEWPRQGYLEAARDAMKLTPPQGFTSRSAPGSAPHTPGADDG